jgi:hypothetical protein
MAQLWHGIIILDTHNFSVFFKKVIQRFSNAYFINALFAAKKSRHGNAFKNE